MTTSTLHLSGERPRPLRIGEAASRAGVNVQTLRYYERRGLLDPDRRHSGHREYDADAVRLVRTIKAAQRLGFSLAEIEELLALTRGRAVGASAVTDLAAQKIREIHLKIEQLEAMRESLQTLVDLGCDSLTSCACPPACPIVIPLDEEGVPE
jgi:redox-sensitive transcriptional activator SoxR